MNTHPKLTFALALTLLLLAWVGLIVGAIISSVWVVLTSGALGSIAVGWGMAKLSHAATDHE